MTSAPSQETLQPAEAVLRSDRDTSLALHWSAFDRMTPVCNPEVRPKFKIDAQKPIFVMGSCFAREIGARLMDMGSDVVDFNFQMAADEWHTIPSVIVNKFTPATIYNEINWCHGILARGDGFRAEDADELLYDVGDGYVIDGSLTGFRPLKRDRAIARRAALYDYFAHIFEAEAVVITLGLIESWWDSERQRFLEEVPQNPKLLARYGAQFHFCKLDYHRCRALLLDTFRLIDSVGGPKKFLITTSPVPIVRTFTDDDVIVANSYGKSLLRAVCGELVDRCPNVDYFPSYEAVTLTRDWSVYTADRRHVERSHIARVVAMVIENYFTNIPDHYRDLTASVLAFHEDVLDHALELAEKVVAAAPASFGGWVQLAKCQARAGNFEAERAAWNKVSALLPDNALALELMADSYCKTGGAEALVERVENFLARHPGVASAERALLKGFYGAGLLRDCVGLAHRLHTLHAMTGDCYAITSRAHEALGDIEAALAAAHMAVRVERQSPESLARLAELEALAAVGR